MSDDALIWDCPSRFRKANLEWAGDVKAKDRLDDSNNKGKIEDETHIEHQNLGIGKRNREKEKCKDRILFMQ